MQHSSVLRLDAAGALHPSSGTAGASIVMLDFSPDGDEATTMLKRSDDRIVVGGQTAFGGIYNWCFFGLTAGGLADPAFAPPTSLVTGSGQNSGRFYDLVLDGQGPSLFCGSWVGNGGVKRCLPNATADLTFGVNGYENAPPTTGMTYHALVTDDQGWIFVVGSKGSGPSTNKSCTIRYSPNGSFDNIYGNADLSDLHLCAGITELFTAVVVDACSSLGKP